VCARVCVCVCGCALRVFNTPDAAQMRSVTIVAAGHSRRATDRIQYLLKSAKIIHRCCQCNCKKNHLFTQILSAMPHNIIAANVAPLSRVATDGAGVGLANTPPPGGVGAAHTHTQREQSTTRQNQYVPFVTPTHDGGSKIDTLTLRARA
jgi:azurin